MKKTRTLNQKRSATAMKFAKGKRIAVVAGLRTPFAKQLTHFSDLNPLELGKMVVNEMMQRSEIDPNLVDLVVFGKVLQMTAAPNIAREIVLGTGMDVNTDAYSVTRACATSFQSIADVAQSIIAGTSEVAIAGGADSSSVIPMGLSKNLTATLLRLSKAKTISQKLNLLKNIRPKDFAPIPPAVKEYSTGLSMGQNAEQMAKDHGITRAEQDELAHRSHVLASQAWSDGKLDDEVMTAFVAPYSDGIHLDNVIRHDSNLEGYAKLRPAFDRSYGTVTAANATPLTDGAAAVMLMKESVAKALGYEPLGYIKSWGFAAIGAERDMLMGPSHATPIALDRAGIQLSDLDLIDMHEAFAAQALCNVKAFGSKTFAQEMLGRSEAIGEIDMDKFNVLGGSIAYGHPFAATGCRMVTQTLRELKRRGGGLGLTTACAAGGLGAAMVLEAE